MKQTQQKVFWKVGVFFFLLLFFALANSFLFSYCCKLEGYTFTKKVIKITSSFQTFQSDPQLETMQSYYFKNTIFSSSASAAVSVDFTVDYIIQHHCG